VINCHQYSVWYFLFWTAPIFHPRCSSLTYSLPTSLPTLTAIMPCPKRVLLRLRCAHGQGHATNVSQSGQSDLNLVSPSFRATLPCLLNAMPQKSLDTLKTLQLAASEFKLEIMNSIMQYVMKENNHDITLLNRIKWVHNLYYYLTIFYGLIPTIVKLSLIILIRSRLR
jgi:hypothetical protein